MAEETPLSSPPPVEKPHGQEVSNTLQFYLLVFTVVFILILGECVMLTRVHAFHVQIYFEIKLTIHKYNVMVMLIQH